jgi:oligo-alginate lyase
VNVGSEAEYYELAYARYHAPEFAVLLKGSRRNGRLALWFGAEKLDAGQLPRAASHNAEASGYAMLEQGEDTTATWLCLKYGPHGGGHGHFDKNHFVLYAGGDVLMPDSGTHAYGSPLHGDWDKSSFAHNTLVVDETTQAAATGKCLCFGCRGDADFAMTDAGEIYPGVRFVRTAVMLSPRLLVFLDQVTCDKSHTLDLVCHHHGAWLDLPAGQPVALSKKPGYRCVNDATTRSTDGGLTLGVTRDKQPASRLVLAGGAPTEVITGTGVGGSTAHRVPVAVFRRTAKETVFVWAVCWDDRPIALQTQGKPDGVVSLNVQAGAAHWQVTASSANGTVDVRP